MINWIKTSEGFFLFGPGGITRFTPYMEWINGEQVCSRTSLYAGTTLITIVNDSLEDILIQIKGIEL